MATVDEIPPGGRKIVQAGRRSIGVFNIDGEFFALRNLCPHQGAPLCLGRTIGHVEAQTPGEFVFTAGGGIITCPHHGWEFDIRTGKSLCDPARLRTAEYAVGVESGIALTPASGAESGRVEGPYTAESIAISIEEQYLVVNLP